MDPAKVGPAVGKSFLGRQPLLRLTSQRSAISLELGMQVAPSHRLICAACEPFVIGYQRLAPWLLEKISTPEFRFLSSEFARAKN